jgi:hypothetical protein
MIFVGKAFNLLAEKVPALGCEPGAFYPSSTSTSTG